MGNQACPSRFFASHQLHLVLVRLITQYDLKLGAPLAKGGHPMAYNNGALTMPDSTMRVMFKRRDADGETGNE